MFRGTFEHTVDDKGRLSVPAKFRDLLIASNDDRVVVTNFQSDSIPCLHVYPYPAWVRLEGQVVQRPQLDPRTQHFQNYYIAAAQDCQLDKQGRILLPQGLRAYAKLEQSVTITGIGEKFSVWDRDAWKGVFGQSEKTVFADPSFLRELGI